MADARPNELRTGIELVIDVVVITDARGRVMVANPAADDLFGAGGAGGAYLDTIFETAVGTADPAPGFLTYSRAGHADPPAQPQQ